MRRCLLAIVLLAVCAPPAGARTITMSGSTPTAALTADLAFFYRQAVHDPPRFSIVGGNTGTGIADATRRIVNVGLVSRALDAQDPPGLRFTPIALSGVCLVTNKANPVPGITRAQIQDLVAGRLTSWTQFPGSARTDAIAPVAFDERGGARAVFLSVFVDLATPVLYQPVTLATAPQMRDYVRSTPNALGYADLAFSGELHVVPYQGVTCSRTTVRSGAYPARRPLGFVTRGRPNRETRRFIRWIRHSRKARQVIATRYVPVRKSSSSAHVRST